MCVYETHHNLEFNIVFSGPTPGTHGNGMEFGNLATLVTGLEFVNGKGEVRK